MGAKLPIRVGIYGNVSENCSDPANAGILSFNGQGLSDVHTHDCHMTIESHQGKLFAYSQKCVVTGTGAGPSSIGPGLMRIESDKRFALYRKGGETIFNYCEPASLPPGIAVPKNN
ncbi:hypothetical protein [Pseudomonas sp. NA-150]|uniref:hypothetical protein n=1 Tax=Pseudomonas sp. NA-150 TaxID=3367525 RepID=UPI0037CA7809